MEKKSIITIFLDTSPPPINSYPWIMDFVCPLFFITATRGGQGLLNEFIVSKGCYPTDFLIQGTKKELTPTHSNNQAVNKSHIKELSKKKTTTSPTTTAGQSSLYKWRTFPCCTEDVT